MRTYYDVLEVRRDASSEDIKRAYHQLALHYHPDKNPSEEAAEKMRQLNEAYQTLSDPAAKARYDARLMMPARAWRPSGENTARATSPSGTDYGYEAPRHTVVYERVTYFSTENFAASAIMGASIGLIIAAAFVFLGIRLDTRPGLAAAALLAAFAMFAPPILTIVQLRKSISSDGEARMIGAIALSATLSFAVAATAIITTLFDGPDQGPNPFCACCGLAPIMAIVGWIIGGWIGKTAREIFPI